MSFRQILLQGSAPPEKGNPQLWTEAPISSELLVVDWPQEGPTDFEEHVLLIRRRPSGQLLRTARTERASVQCQRDASHPHFNLLWDRSAPSRKQVSKQMPDFVPLRGLEQWLKQSVLGCFGFRWAGGLPGQCRNFLQKYLTACSKSSIPGEQRPEPTWQTHPTETGGHSAYCSSHSC